MYFSYSGGREATVVLPGAAVAAAEWATLFTNAAKFGPWLASTAWTVGSQTAALPTDCKGTI